MRDQPVLVQSGAVRHSMGLAGEGCSYRDGQVFGRSAGSQDAELTDDVVAAADSIDETRVDHATKEICRGGRRAARSRHCFSEGEPRLAIGNEIIHESKGWAVCRGVHFPRIP